MAMFFADARHLLELCVEYGVIQTMDGGLLIYREASETDPEGWYLDAMDDVAQELMPNEEGQNMLINALAEKGVVFERHFENNVDPMMGQIIEFFRKE